MSTVWEDTDGFAKQYMCDFYIYFITVLSYLYSIITDRENNALGHRNNDVDGINAADKKYLNLKKTWLIIK